MTTITIDSMCNGLGHWFVSVTESGQIMASFPADWACLQVPLGADESERLAHMVPATAEDYERLALLALRARCCGAVLSELEPLLANGVIL